MENEEDRRLVTRAEAAYWLRISIRKIDQLVAEGLIGRVKIGTAVRFDIQDLLDFIHSSKDRGVKP